MLSVLLFVDYVFGVCARFVFIFLLILVLFLLLGEGMGDR